MTCIALVGMMGSGKSTVGLALSEALSLPFIDLDREIERSQGRPIPSIFSVEGESAFREHEKRALEAAIHSAPSEGLVLSTGGGIVTTEACRITLQDCAVVWLHATPQTIAMRLEHESAHRPLLQGDPKSLVHRIASLLESRVPLYESVSDVRIDVDNQSVDSIVKMICHWGGLRRCKG